MCTVHTSSSRIHLFYEAINEISEGALSQQLFPRCDARTRRIAMTTEPENILRYPMREYSGTASPTPSANVEIHHCIVQSKWINQNQQLTILHPEKRFLLLLTWTVSTFKWNNVFVPKRKENHALWYSTRRFREAGEWLDGGSPLTVSQHHKKCFHNPLVTPFTSKPLDDVAWIHEHRLYMQLCIMGAWQHRGKVPYTIGLSP